MLLIYGLKNCDTCRKAQKWLKEKEIAFEFKDVRLDGVDHTLVQGWLSHVGVETLLNKRGTTWRTLDESAKSIASDEDAIAVMVAHPALIKRPVFILEQTVIVGFAKKQQEELNSLL